MLEIDLQGRRGSFSLEVKLQLPGGITALVGPSGAGKSSLLRLVAGLDTPERGFVRLDGRPLPKRPEARRVGMVFQTPRLVPHLSVAGNIGLGARGQEFSALIEDTGVTPLLDRPISALSGGERQRVMLARALAGRPDILLLDEPLSAIDPDGKQNLLALFARLVPRLEIPVIYVTHAMDEAARLADRFVLMRAGRVEAVGGAADILARYDESRIYEAGVGSVLEGVVTACDADGMAHIDVGGQGVEVQGTGLGPGDSVMLRLWARDVLVARSRPEGLSARNALRGTIAAVNPFQNGEAEIEVKAAGATIRALVMVRTVAEMGLAPGQSITVLFKSASVERGGG